MNNTILNLKLLGKEVLTELDELIQFSTKTKKEQNYYLNSGDAAEVIDYSDVINPRAIIFLSDNPFNVALKDATNTINLKIKEILVLTPEDLSVVTSIELTSLNTDKHYIQVRFYGVE
jgi:hypothetical protein